RLLRGPLVELAAPVAVEPEHRVAPVLASAADERVRDPVSDDGIDHVARARRLDAFETRAGAAAGVGRKHMTGGMIPGGWNFVVAAYSVTALVLLIYGASVITRLRADLRRIDD